MFLQNKLPDKTAPESFEVLHYAALAEPELKQEE